jgi:hypothetical protein
MSHEKPLIHKLLDIKPIDDLEKNFLHSGIRFMHGKHIFLVDHHNFYEIDPKTGH